jgi:alkylation response protein AidB-like acyl-CoA dehydrogenase
MDFSAVVLTGAQQAFAQEVRAFLDQHLTEDVYARIRERAVHFDEEFYLALGAKGWLEPRWRKEDGGAELDNVCVKILETELARRHAPIGPIGLTNLAWPAVESSADPGLRDELKPQVARGTARISLAYTEPDGGSDIAAAKTRAVRDGDEWVINGQKIFTTNAQFATHIFLLTRTDPTLPKHKGLTMFLVPTSSPGFDRQPLPTSAMRRPTSPTTATCASLTGTASGTSITAGRHCTARWMPSITSGITSASSRRWAPAQIWCIIWRGRSRPPCAGPRPLRPRMGR